MTSTYREIIKLKYPDKKPRKFIDDTYEGIIWNSLDATPNPSKAELDQVIIDTVELSPIVDKNINDAILVHKAESNPHEQYVNNSIVQIISVPSMSGTSRISLDNTIPLITEGTEIATINLAASSSRSILSIEGNFQIDCSANNKTFILALFKSTTCLGVICNTLITSAKPLTMPFAFYDKNLGLSFGGMAVRYSLRVGLNSNATWYLNTMKNATMGGLSSNNCLMFKEYV